MAFVPVASRTVRRFREGVAAMLASMTVYIWSSHKAARAASNHKLGFILLLILIVMAMVISACSSKTTYNSNPTMQTKRQQRTCTATTGNKFQHKSRAIFPEKY